MTASVFKFSFREVSPEKSLQDLRTVPDNTESIALFLTSRYPEEVAFLTSVLTGEAKVSPIVRRRVSIQLYRVRNDSSLWYFDWNTRESMWALKLLSVFEEIMASPEEPVEEVLKQFATIYGESWIRYLLNEQYLGNLIAIYYPERIGHIDTKKLTQSLVRCWHWWESVIELWQENHMFTSSYQNQSES